jgi:aromatic ring-cleaving dioxygenase
MSSPAPILSYHAHVYYDPTHSRGVADALRQRIGERFIVQMGRWHDVPVGPHTAAMYQVAFAPELFATFLPWLMLHRDGLDVLVHPNTLAPRDDHLRHALWLGDKRALKEEVLPVRIDAADESPIVPNTSPTLELP